MNPDLPKFVVCFATAGRRELMTETLRHLAKQTRAPDEVIIALASADDIDESIFSELPYPVRVRIGPRGLTSQRNVALRSLSDEGYIVFFDDDFLMAVDYLEECEKIFLARPDIAVITGEVVADGIIGPGLEVEHAKHLLDTLGPREALVVRDIYNAYGCNMAYRVAHIKALKAEFDEALPLYGWLEDVDFSCRLAAAGRVVWTNACRGVHLGIKRARQSGLMFGYSQVANPIYLLVKGSIVPGKAFGQMSRNLLANAARVAFPEPWVDRRGRAKGNVLALRDLFLGRLKPQNILDFH